MASILEGLINGKVIDINDAKDVKEKERIYHSLKEDIQFAFDNGVSINERSVYYGKKYVLEDLRMSCDLSGFMYTKIPEFIVFLEDCGLEMEEDDFNNFMFNQSWTDREESNQAFKWMCERYDYDLYPLIVVNFLNINPYIAENDIFEVILQDQEDMQLFTKSFLEENKVPYYLFNTHDNLTLIKYITEKYHINLSEWADINEEGHDFLFCSTFETTAEYFIERGVQLKEENMEDYSERMVGIQANVEKKKLSTSLQVQGKLPNQAKSRI